MSAFAAYRPWVLLAAFSLVLFTVTAATFSSLGVVLPAMVKEGNWSWTNAGLGFTLLGAACGCSSFLPALLIRRIGVRAVLLAGTGVMGAGFLSLGFSHGLPLYFLGTTLCGVGYQMMALIPGTHVLSAVFKRRAFAFGVYFTFGSLGGVAGPWLVMGVMHAFHDQWRVFWFSQLAVSLLAGAICAAVVGSSLTLSNDALATEKALSEAEEASSRREGRRPISGDWTAREAMATPQFWVLFLAYFGHLLVMVSVASLSVAHLTERGVSAAVAGAMLSLESLLQMGGRLVAGAVGELIDPRYLLIFGLALAAIGSAALGTAHDYPTMLVYASGTGIGCGITALTVTVLLLEYFGRKHNLEIFSITCLVGGASACGPLIGGAVRDHFGSFTPAFQVFGGLLAVVFVCAAFMKPPVRRAPPRPVRETLQGLVEEPA